jgi:lipopolysaccharide/colanic/teichoic acid biosynthesis glycosyltransferase
MKVSRSETGASLVIDEASLPELTGRIEKASNRVGTRLVKRAFDLAFASVFLVVLSPILLLAAIAIRLTSPGSAIYRQNRVGKDEKVFALFKLRTMIQDAEPDGVPVWATEDDPRITRVGKVLRMTFVDEFPQLWNVLKGDMSIVGPRPERPELVRDLEVQIPLYRLRHTVRPGMAGWALIHQGYGRSVEDTMTKLQYDLYYILNQSFRFDLQIIVRTMQRSISMRRAEKKQATD